MTEEFVDVVAGTAGLAALLALLAPRTQSPCIDQPRVSIDAIGFKCMHEEVCSEAVAACAVTVLSYGSRVCRSQWVAAERVSGAVLGCLVSPRKNVLWSENEIG